MEILTNFCYDDIGIVFFNIFFDSIFDSEETAFYYLINLYDIHMTFYYLIFI